MVTVDILAQVFIKMVFQSGFIMTNDLVFFQLLFKPAEKFKRFFLAEGFNAGIKDPVYVELLFNPGV